MDKYEFNIKVEQIKKLVNREDYETAMKIADAIDWRRVRNASLLTMVAKIYEKNEEYQEAKDILLLAFERAPVGKRLLYKLTDLALKEGSIEEAEAYYREFCDLAQEDPRQYLLRYLILKAKDAPVDQLIRALEKYTSTEIDEKWMYELAELYHKAGMEEKCISTCDMIMLLFGLGKYVDKAMDLKLEYAPLNKYQMDLVENRDKYEAKLRAVEEEYGNGSRKRERRMEKMPEPTERLNENADEQVIRIREEEQEEMLAREMERMKMTEEPRATVVEDDMEATRIFENVRSIRDRREPDSFAEEDEDEIEKTEEDWETERQRASIRAAKAREEMEEEAIRRAEEEREKARREEEERRLKKQAEIDRERARRQAKNAVAEEAEEEEIAETNHLMIEADSGEAGLSLALEALKKIHRELGYKNPVAKISSDRLNEKGICAIAEKLSGKDLIVEHAAGLSNAAQNELDDLMEKDQTGMIVVLIDTSANLEAFHAHNTSLASKFQYIGAEKKQKAAQDYETALKKETLLQEKLAKEADLVKEAVSEVMEPETAAGKAEREALERDRYESDEQEGKPAGSGAGKKHDKMDEMDIDEFAQYASKYASEIDCSITGKSMLALYERIEMMEEDGIRLTKKAAENLIEEAADKAEKKTLGRKLTGLFSPTYDKEGCLILREKDFF